MFSSLFPLPPRPPPRPPSSPVGGDGTDPPRNNRRRPKESQPPIKPAPLVEAVRRNLQAIEDTAAGRRTLGATAPLRARTTSAESSERHADPTGLFKAYERNKLTKKNCDNHVAFKRHVSLHD